MSFESGSIVDVPVSDAVAVPVSSITDTLGAEFISAEGIQELGLTTVESFNVPYEDIAGFGGYQQAGSLAGSAAWNDAFNRGDLISGAGAATVPGFGEAAAGSIGPPIISAAGVAELGLSTAPNLTVGQQITQFAKQVQTDFAGFVKGSQEALAAYQKVAPLVNLVTAALKIENPVNQLIQPFQQAVGIAGQVSQGAGAVASLGNIKTTASSVSTTGTSVVVPAQPRISGQPTASPNVVRGADGIYTVILPADQVQPTTSPGVVKGADGIYTVTLGTPIEPGQVVSQPAPGQIDTLRELTEAETNALIRRNIDPRLVSSFVDQGGNDTRTQFTGTATATNSDVAEALAIEEAQARAINQFGPNTQFSGVPTIYVKINDNGTYTATYTTLAQEGVVPPNVSAADPADTIADGAIDNDVSNFDPNAVPPDQTPYRDGTATGADLDIAFDAGPVQPSQTGFTGIQRPVVNALNLVAQAVPVPPAVAAVAAAVTAVIPSGGSVATQQNALTAGLADAARNQQSVRELRNNKAQSSDWRVRLRLAPNSNYLYNEPSVGPNGPVNGPGIMAPLRATDGVIFPYTPSIDTAYKANYEAYDLTHSNYRGYFYKNSYVDVINIRATFTAQDTNEANYLLAVIHFFRSATKMFYGQDASLRGAPPPLVYLNGYGNYQFSEHPCVISQFNYQLPPDVDYIRCQSWLSNNTNLQLARIRNSIANNPLSYSVNRILNSGLLPGAKDFRPSLTGNLADGEPSYVPTKMEISVSLLPIQSRSQVSQNFSVKEFANGNLLKGGYW